MNFDYILSLALLCLACAGTIYSMKYMKQPRWANFLFGCMVFFPYLWRSWIIYQDVGFYDWNFQNTLPTANVSPFMFCMMPILLILPKKAKKAVYLLVSLLSVGMFGATVFGCVYNAIINYKFHFQFLLDDICHCALSLFGIYLIRSKQVELTTKNCLISAGILLGSATGMMLLNCIFDTAFFGLSLRGKHNIYNMVLVSDPYLSALIYYLGVSVILFLGYLLCRVFARKKLPI